MRVRVPFFGGDCLFLLLILIAILIRRFFDMARDSTLECAVALDVLTANGRLERTSVDSGKERLHFRHKNNALPVVVRVVYATACAMT